MKRRISKKLSIKKETVANLTLEKQRAVAGGAYPTSLKGDCYSNCESNCTMICVTVCLACESDPFCVSMVGGCTVLPSCAC